MHYGSSSLYTSPAVAAGELGTVGWVSEASMPQQFMPQPPCPPSIAQLLVVPCPVGCSHWTGGCSTTPLPLQAEASKVREHQVAGSDVGSNMRSGL
jgi:hypothetical protein